MSKVHILTADNNKNYTIVVHTATPAGSNSAGFSWKNVALASGIGGASKLTVGTAPGNIGTAESGSITAGNILEFRSSIPAESGGAGTASVNQMADEIINFNLGVLSNTLKYYGYTQG